MKKMFKLLIEAGANGRYVRDGKSLLILALEMLNARLVLPALLSAFMGSLVNEDFNLYRWVDSSSGPCHISSTINSYLIPQSSQH
jgi:hypothetical protein